MPPRPIHDGEHALDHVECEMSVEDIGHAVDEYAPWLPPTQGLFETLEPKPGSEGIRTTSRRVAHRLMTQINVPCLGAGDGRRITVIAARGHLRTAGHRVPRRIGPLDASSFAHCHP